MYSFSAVKPGSPQSQVGPLTRADFRPQSNHSNERDGAQSHQQQGDHRGGNASASEGTGASAEGHPGDQILADGDAESLVA